MMPATACVICGEPIPEARREVIPHTITCCSKHSAEHKRRLRRASARRCMKRKRAKGEGGSCDLES